MPYPITQGRSSRVRLWSADKERLESLGVCNRGIRCLGRKDPLSQYVTARPTHFRSFRAPFSPDSDQRQRAGSIVDARMPRLNNLKLILDRCQAWGWRAYRVTNATMDGERWGGCGPDCVVLQRVFDETTTGHPSSQTNQTAL